MEEKKNKSTKGGAKWKEVVIGGVAGISLGVGSAVLMGSALNHDNQPSDNTEEPTDNIPEQEEMPLEEHAAEQGYAAMATGVTDDMSFDEAFAAARAEVGAGGVFEWHGGLYGTYYASEWNAMDDDARQDFADSVPWHSAQHYTGGNHQNDVDNSDDDNLVLDDQNDNDDDQDNDDDNLDDLDDQLDDDPEIEILGVEHASLDGETESIVGAANVDGQTVYFVDVDGTDNEFDYMMVDLNGDSAIDDNEIIDISDEHLSVSDFEALANANNDINDVNGDDLDQMYANNDTLPDYVNDVDPGALE